MSRQSSSRSPACPTNTPAAGEILRVVFEIVPKVASFDGTDFGHVIDLPLLALSLGTLSAQIVAKCE